MTTNFTPFSSNEQSMVLTDTHGNELNIESTKDELVIYGQWQGKAQAPEFISFLAILNQAQETLTKENHVTTDELAGFSLSKKKEELLLDADVTIGHDKDSAAKLLKLLNKVKKITA